MAQAADKGMRAPRIEKVVVHMAVGHGGDDLRNAEAILEAITGQRSVRTLARETEPEFGIRQGDPIGAKVTLRDEAARDFLERALPLVSVSRHQFDDTGNLSFGVEEHTAFEGQEYDPDVGIFGLDVTAVLVRPGYRVTKRDKRAGKIPAAHRLSVEDSMAFLEREFGMEVA